MFQRAEALAEKLLSLTDAEHIVIRTSPHSETQEGFDAPVIASPGTPDSVTIQEYGTRFRIRFDEGHKTGFFCDQRENRRKLTEFTAGRSVADVCCYTTAGLRSRPRSSARPARSRRSISTKRRWHSRSRTRTSIRPESAAFTPTPSPGCVTWFAMVGSSMCWCSIRRS